MLKRIVFLSLVFVGSPVCAMSMSGSTDAATTCSEVHARLATRALLPGGVYCVRPVLAPTLVQCAVADSREDYTDDCFIPKDCDIAIKDMLEREKQFSSYHAFYHGNSGQYAVFVQLAQRLYEQRYGYRLPDDHVLLRCPGTRERLDPADAQAFNVDPTWGDHVPATREELLPVSYTPIQRGSYESAWFFFTHNTSMSEFAFSQFVSDLFAAYGYTVPQIVIMRALVRFNPCYGLMLQVLIHDRVVHDCAYDSWVMGERTPYGSTWKRRKALMQAALIENGVEAALKDFLVAQARILLKPSLFDQPNENVKMKLYTFFSAEEQRALGSVCDEIMGLALQSSS